MKDHRAPDAPSETPPVVAASSTDAAPPEALVSATQEFPGAAQEADAEVCDACGATIAADDDDGYAIRGSGLYVWTRGTEVRYEEPPLCAACASAIGMSALARWEIEEEEG